MTTLYKLTDQNMQTYGGYQWVLGEERTTSGYGDLCGPGWLHAYTDPLLAVILNPIHANYLTPKLFRADGEVGKTDHGLKVGCTKLVLTEEMKLPQVELHQLVAFGILCALEVYKDEKFIVWANSWISGADRSYDAANAAWYAARDAARDAAIAYAADAATNAAIAYANAARDAARYAARYAAAEKPLDLIALAHQAMETKP